MTLQTIKWQLKIQRLKKYNKHLLLYTFSINPNILIYASKSNVVLTISSLLLMA